MLDFLISVRENQCFCSFVNFVLWDEGFVNANLCFAILPRCLPRFFKQKIYFIYVKLFRETTFKSLLLWRKNFMRDVIFQKYWVVVAWNSVLQKSIDSFFYYPPLEDGTLFSVRIPKPKCEAKCAFELVKESNRKPCRTQKITRASSHQLSI